MTTLSKILLSKLIIAILRTKPRRLMVWHVDYVVCIVSLASAGLQQLLVQCDDYCRKLSITFNVSKSICVFFKSAVNRKCDTTDLLLSSKAID